MRYLDQAHVAPLWKRSLARSLDGLPELALVLMQIWRRDWRTAPLVRASLMADAYAVAAPTIFGRTVGQRVCNIRVVSQETGRSPAFRQSLVMWAVLRVPRMILTWWPKSPQLAQFDAATKALRLEVEQKHRGDREARDRAVMALFKERDVIRPKPLVPPLVRYALYLAYGRMLSVSLRRDPLKQGLAGRRAKILVIDERPSSFPRLAELIGRRELVPIGWPPGPPGTTSETAC